MNELPDRNHGSQYSAESSGEHRTYSLHSGTRIVSPTQAPLSGRKRRCDQIKRGSRCTSTYRKKRLRNNQNDEGPKQGTVSAPQGRSAQSLEASESKE